LKTVLSCRSFIVGNPINCYLGLDDLLNRLAVRVQSTVVVIARWSVLLSLLLASVTLLQAQEVKYLDLTAVQQRTELRYPPAPPVSCGASGPCVGGGYGSASIGDGAPDIRNPQALRIDLLGVDPVEIDPETPLEAEFRVFNTGRVPLELPVSPHLSDLQPGEASVDFSYFSLALVVMATAEPQQADLRSLGFVELYGSPEHGGTMVSLKPGEWIRVKTNMKFRTWPSEPVSARLHGGFWLRSNTYHPHPGGSSIAMNNLYPNVTQSDPATWLHVNFIHHPSEQQNAKP
jgi:hypothetical protein